MGIGVLRRLESRDPLQLVHHLNGMPLLLIVLSLALKY
jgi:hypothetical protein